MLDARGEAIGVATNNVAEYAALVAGLFLDASRHARKIHRVTYTAVRREHNELADSLVNEALDRSMS